MSKNKDQCLAIAKSLSDFLLLNAHSLPQSTLANGKAGVALALGLLGKALDDEYIQDQSVDILEEALLYKGQDLSFDDGWAGICWVLIVLLREELLDADYNELVEDKHQAIIKSLEVLQSRETLGIKGRFEQLILLEEYELLYPSPSISPLLSNIVSTLEDEVAKLLNTWCSLRADKRVRLMRASDLLSLVSTYLKTVQRVRRVPRQQIIGLLEACYESGGLPHSYLLGLLLEQTSVASASELALRNLKYGAIKLNQPLYLREILDVLIELRNTPLTYERGQLIQPLETRIGIVQELDESKLINHLPNAFLRVGYGYGISRLVLYLIGRDISSIL